ncbi:CYC2-like cyclin 6, putative [Trypanosoma cruzi marinkellei]|uniref:CYC2-like cyclin 6, putative n=1 Tax=Trypanosoma cruzi marinkellei TaxID=85056 RepID=K2P9C1_TRYCR|nr:CYC2-like cyclin 6, putative [Trypanosoma cruzi marinkellei]
MIAKEKKRKRKLQGSLRGSCSPFLGCLCVHVWSCVRLFSLCYFFLFCFVQMPFAFLIIFFSFSFFLVFSVWERSGMSTRTGLRSPAQDRMGRIITMYIQHIMELQSGLEENAPEAEFALPNDSFPSFVFFCAEFVPGISLERYAQRLVTYMKCSAEVFIFSLAYIRRLLILGFPLHFRSIYRVLLTSLVVAAKTRDDLCCSMGYYARVGGVTNRDLNIMELWFLADLLEFRTEVQPDEYRTVCNAITAVLSTEKVSRNPTELRGAVDSKTPKEDEKNTVGLGASVN